MGEFAPAERDLSAAFVVPDAVGFGAQAVDRDADEDGGRPVAGASPGHTAWVRGLVGPCLGALVACTGAARGGGGVPVSRRWALLTRRVLAPARGRVPAVKLAALNALWACLRCGGDEYCTVVLSVVVPAVAELMEDLSPVVVRKAHATVRLLKELSGEERVAEFFSSGGIGGDGRRRQRR